MNRGYESSAGGDSDSYEIFGVDPFVGEGHARRPPLMASRRGSGPQVLDQGHGGGHACGDGVGDEPDLAVEERSVGGQFGTGGGADLGAPFQPPCSRPMRAPAMAPNSSRFFQPEVGGFDGIDVAVVILGSRPVGPRAG